MNVLGEDISEPLVDAKVAAKTLAVDRAEVYRMARSKQIPSYRVGAKLSGLRFSLSEVKAVLRRGA